MLHRHDVFSLRVSAWNFQVTGNSEAETSPSFKFDVSSSENNERRSANGGARETRDWFRWFITIASGTSRSVMLAGTAPVGRTIRVPREISESPVV